MASEAVEWRWRPSGELRALLRPYLDLESAGPDGFERWLTAVVPLLPHPRDPGAPPHLTDESLSAHLLEVARSLADLESARARDHWAAAQYFRDNVLLLRRVKALEAVLKTAQRTGRVPNLRLPDDEPGPDERRYLPPSPAEGTR